VLFHPEYKADPTAISPSVRAEIARAGFRPGPSVTAATFISTRSFEGDTETHDVQQTIAQVDELLTEKRSRRYGRRYYEENVGLYAGPLLVIRHTRNVLPVIGSVLPRHFWTSSHVSAFAVQHVDASFPHRSGGVLVASVTYDDHHADGELMQTERVQLRCVVSDVVSAASIDPRLPGMASRVNCEEKPEQDGRVVAPKGHDSVVIENVKYTHLYVPDLGWSIPVEGERTGRMEDVRATERWKSELKSFAQKN
jgi:hypothetical protein